MTYCNFNKIWILISVINELFQIFLLSLSWLSIWFRFNTVRTFVTNFFNYAAILILIYKSNFLNLLQFVFLLVALRLNIIASFMEIMKFLKCLFGCAFMIGFVNINLILFLFYSKCSIMRIVFNLVLKGWRLFQFWFYVNFWFFFQFKLYRDILFTLMLFYLIYYVYVRSN